MARRWRVGLASSPKLLGVVTAAVLIVALLVTGRLLNSGGGRPSAPPAGSGSANSQAPYRIGGRVECPPDWPVLAMSNPTSYPAGHPAKPPATAAPLACYQTAAKAGQRRLSARAAARRGAGGRWRLPDPDQPQVPGALPAGRRPARLRGALPGAAAHHAAWPAATNAVRGAVELPARGAARVHPGGVRGPRGLRRSPRHAAPRCPGDLRGDDRRSGQSAAVPERAPDRHPDRAQHPSRAGPLPRPPKGPAYCCAGPSRAPSCC
jgi:hypothetical protein